MEIESIKEHFNKDINSISRIIRYENGTTWLFGMSLYDDIFDIHAHNFDIDHAPSNVTFTINNEDVIYEPFSNFIDSYNGYKEMLDPFYKENKKRITFSKDNDNVIITFYNDNLNYDPDIEYGDYGYKFSIIYYKYQETEDKQALLNLFNDLKGTLQNNKVKKIEPR